MKKFFAGAMAICLSFVLCSCGSLDIFDSGPKNASDLMNKVQESLTEKNYALDGSLEMGISVESSGFSLNIPIEISVNGKVNGDESFSKMSIAASVLGQNTTEEIEVYKTKDKIYTNDGNQWIVSDAEESTEKPLESDNVLSGFLALDAFSEADMTVNDNLYTVELPMSEIDKNDLIELFSFGTNGDSIVTEGDMAKALSEGTLVYVVEKDGKNYFLQSIVMDDVTCEIKSEDTGVGYPMDISIGFEFNLSDHGSITKEDVAVPDNAIEEAAEKQNEPDQNLPTNTTSEDKITGSSSDELTANSENSVFAVYGTRVLTPGSVGVDFFSNEFSYDENDIGEYSFLPLEYKANNYVNLYLYGSDPDSSENILSDKIYGYKFSTIPDELSSGNLPKVSFGNVSWGSSKDSVKKEFGDPDHDYASDGYWSLSYDLGDLLNDGATYTLEFAGYDETGVHSMALNYYKF